MIKVISAAQRHPTNRSHEEFRNYWPTNHGPLFAHTPELRRYHQHVTIPEAKDMANYDGASVFYYDDIEALKPQPSPILSEVVTREKSPATYDWYVATKRYGDPDKMTLRETVLTDDRQLFDRSTEWPISNRRATVAVTEKVVVDGKTTPDMIKVMWIAAKKPGLSLPELFDHWFNVHGQFGSKVPGVRRYVQNHGIPEAYALRPMTYDGYSEMWFDDLESYVKAKNSKEWEKLSEDGPTLFTYPMATVIAREVIIKGD